MKFQFIYCVQVLWINLYIVYCWNQTASRLQCQHNLSKVPAHYLALTYSTVWLLDSNILLYTDIRKKQIYSIQVKWNNFRLIGCIYIMHGSRLTILYTHSTQQSGSHMVVFSYNMHMHTCDASLHHKIYLQCVPFPVCIRVCRKNGI